MNLGDKSVTITSQETNPDKAAVPSPFTDIPIEIPTANNRGMLSNNISPEELSILAMILSG